MAGPDFENTVGGDKMPDSRVDDKPPQRIRAAEAGRPLLASGGPFVFLLPINEIRPHAGHVPMILSRVGAQYGLQGGTRGPLSILNVARFLFRWFRAGLLGISLTLMNEPPWGHAEEHERK